MFFENTFYKNSTLSTTIITTNHPFAAKQAVCASSTMSRTLRAADLRLKNERNQANAYRLFDVRHDPQRCLISILAMSDLILFCCMCLCQVEYSD